MKNNTSYTQIPNFYIDEILPNLTSLSEAKVLFIILRQIYGFHKTKDYISNSQLVKKTKLSEKSVIKAKKLLNEKHILNFESTYNTVVTIDESDTSKVTVHTSKVTVQTEHVTVQTEQVTDTKENIIKENKIKETTTTKEKIFDDVSKEIFEQLKKIGITEKKAQELCEKYDPKYLKAHIESLKIRKANNKAAYLVASIENNYQTEIPETKTDKEENKNKNKIFQNIYRNLETSEPLGESTLCKLERAVDKIREYPNRVNKLTNEEIAFLLKEIETEKTNNLFYTQTKKDEFLKLLAEGKK